MKLENGLIIPTKHELMGIHDSIIRESEQAEKHYGIRDDSVLEHLCSKLQIHRYAGNGLANAYYIGTEVFFHIACRHPFVDGNKRTAQIASQFFIRTNLIEMGYGAGVEIVSDDVGKVVETIARWCEGSDRAALEKLIYGSGVIGKRSREITETDVKSYINAFLRNTIRIKKAG